MRRKSSDLKAAIEKLKKLKALQIKATDKLNKITQDAAGKPPKKKKAAVQKSGIKRKTKPIIKRKTKQAVKSKPTGKKQTKTAVKKGSVLKRLFGKKAKTVKSRQSTKVKRLKKRARRGVSEGGGGNFTYIVV